MDDVSADPLEHDGVMVSSTFKDLEAHRAALMDALRKEGLHAVGMEDAVARAGEGVISASLRMVREAAAYICLIGHRCGQCPPCDTRNAKQYSITRLEFQEAQSLKRPTLVFTMSQEHLLKPGDVETDPASKTKLDDFREYAKAGRIRVSFDSLEDFTKKAIHAVAQLRRDLDQQKAHQKAKGGDTGTTTALATTTPASAPAPTAPAFHAEPDYLGSYNFVGRRSELEIIDDWAEAADTHPVLLFEAMGGTGKSMLTWQWVQHHSLIVRQDWAGRYWYSFYERGAIMEDFVRHAVAYIHGVPPETLNHRKMPDLSAELLEHLKHKPYLFILDGLERVLVTYNRLDAAQLNDDEADDGKDPISHRDPYSAIRPADDEFLRKLSADGPSKILITTRLTPSSLLNPARQAIPGVVRLQLTGLRPADAESLLRLRARGDSAAIMAYLKTNCDCHPLVTGVLAGLINDYLADPGNFDQWSTDSGSTGGLRLNLAELDLKQRKNHILKASIDALEPKSRELLFTLSLITGAVDAETLTAFNPHLPPIPAEVEEPTEPKENWRWRTATEEKKAALKAEYANDLAAHQAYHAALKARLASAEFKAAPKRLSDTVNDLRRRGLLQYDANSKHYDMHPVVRGVASGGLQDDEKDRYGQSVVDYFNAKPHNPWEEAKTFADVESGVQVVRTLIQMGKMEGAAAVYRGELSQALSNLEAHADILSLLRPFFPSGWGIRPSDLEDHTAAYLCNDAGLALNSTGDQAASLAVYGEGIRIDLDAQSWQSVRAVIGNIMGAVLGENRLARAEGLSLLELDLASALADEEQVFMAKNDRMGTLGRIGRYAEAGAVWDELNPMGRDWSRARFYRPGDAEYGYAVLQFEQGALTEEHLSAAEELARKGNNRAILRYIHGLRGAWLVDNEKWLLAVESLSTAVRMAREVGQVDATPETLLALAQSRLGMLHDPKAEAERLAALKDPAHRRLAGLLLAIGDKAGAVKQALAGYKLAWADGEPFVHRYGLTKSAELLTRLGVPIPVLPAYDPAKDPPFPWEAEVRAAIVRLNEEKASKEAEKKAGNNDGGKKP